MKAIKLFFILALGFFISSQVYAQVDLLNSQGGAAINVPTMTADPEAGFLGDGEFEAPFLFFIVVACAVADAVYYSENDKGEAVCYKVVKGWQTPSSA